MLDFTSYLIVFYNILVNSTQPCFLNATAGQDVLQNCGFGIDYIKGAITPFEWITGGLFTEIVVAVIMLVVYLKYLKVIYPIMIGAIYLPLAAQYFPATFVNWAIIMAGVGLGGLVYYAWISATNES